MPEDEILWDWSSHPIPGTEEEAAELLKARVFTMEDEAAAFVRQLGPAAIVFERQLSNEDVEYGVLAEAMEQVLRALAQFTDRAFAVRAHDHFGPAASLRALNVLSA